ncbi:ACT domain-containing protein ACR4-like [Phalaenopsis equestris]|uniref:ACT domain-containing protein ACR4-like n=1 Tax=Phalaenopsis equestris TaxID=78828 RepID=UPI0009E6207A|nr:ACT domain-containing protein ACR4-like [Phalaenopsis equestris]
MNGHIMFNEIEEQNVIRSLAAAVERRMSRGLKMEVHTSDRHGLLSVMSRKLRENNMSFKTAEFAKDGCLAIGTFYITDNDADNIDQQKVKMLEDELEKDILFEKKNDHNINSTIRGRRNIFSAFCSLGRSLWFHIKRIISTFNFIR